MSGLRGEKPQNELFVVRILCFSVLLGFFAQVPGAIGQEQTGGSVQVASPPQQHPRSEAVASLQDLLTEAEQNNPQIHAARQGWQAAKQVPSQVSTLPDPQFNVQQVNVGNPRPFAGYTNSDFAYIGLGVSQDFPYPGKLRLKSEIANRDAEVVQQRYESIRRSILAGVKSAYFQLAYLSKTLGILESDGELLQQVEKAADARYRSGVGSQHDLLQAQIERTKLLREITMHHLDVAKLQAQIKQLLNRPQSSPDIEPSELSETPLPNTFEELLSATKTQNPEISGAEKMVERQKLQVNLAHKDFYPDFNVQYMWQRTDPAQFRAYYMLSVGIKVPIYHRRKQRPELAQAELELNRSHSESEVQSQQVAFELRSEYETAQKTAELLKIYREGLVPQTRAGFQAGIAAYQNNRQDFQALLASFLDVLHLDEEYWKSIAERETALVRLEQLTGLSLRVEGAKR
ncbi:MAG TPA: TolC family protein [Candidatus Dormibacteraeota bacterium]|nr:TolC family protein [Candidatus Dormibacteraeota bacterium]